MWGRFRGDFLVYTKGLQHGQTDSSAYPPEFRHKVLELVRSGRSVAEVSRQFDVSRQTIMNWLKQDDADSGRREDVLTSSERTELTQLRRKNKRLKLEQELLPTKAQAGTRSARVVNTIMR